MRCLGPIVFLSCLEALLVACAADPQSARYRDLIGGLFSRNRITISRDQAAAVPFASIGVMLGSSNQSMMVLGLSQEGRQEWFTRTQMIATRDGRIVQTSGLPSNLNRLEMTSVPGTAPGVASGAPSTQSPYFLVLDFQDLNLFGATAECISKDVGEDIIVVLGTRLQTRHLVEQCKLALIDWSFENEFWIDPGNRFVWRSRQYVHPKIAPVTFEVFRPVAS